MSGFQSYPEFRLSERQLIFERVFDKSLGDITSYRDAFFPFALLDAAAFHQVLANLTFLLRYSRPAKRAKPEAYENIEVAIQHGEALRLLKSRIKDQEAAISPGTAGAIISLACHAVGFF